jgi:plasmid replication initiation protein
VSTSIRQPVEGRRHRFSWINEWQERTNRQGRPDGIELIVPTGSTKPFSTTLILTIDPAYFDLTGGLDRWLYRLVRKHGGRQRAGWRFDLRHLHLKSGSLSPFKRFAFELRDIVRPAAARLPPLSRWRLVGALLAFEPLAACGKAVDGLVLSGTRTIVPSGTRGSCHQEPKSAISYGKHG